METVTKDVKNVQISMKGQMQMFLPTCHVERATATSLANTTNCTGSTTTTDATVTDHHQRSSDSKLYDF